MKLINKTTGQEVKVGDKVTTFRGEEGILKDYTHNRVYVQLPSSPLIHTWYPDVINCEIVAQ